MRYSWAICTLFVVAVGCDTRRASASESDTLVLELGGARPVLRKVLDDVRERTAAERGAPVEDLGASELSPRPKAPRYAILREGETLSQLSQRTLGTWRRWEEIAELNHIETPHAVKPDTKLRLPE